MIIIKKSATADTRTCDYTKVTKQTLLESSNQHIDDVQKGMFFLSDKLQEAGRSHDWSKTENIDEFYADFKTNFEKTDWWKFHQKEERHHFNNKEFIQEDVNLLDVLEQIVDGCMAGMARSGEYRFEPLSNELLQKAYLNTSKLLLKNMEVEQ